MMMTNFLTDLKRLASLSGADEVSITYNGILDSLSVTFMFDDFTRRTFMVADTQMNLANFDLFEEFAMQAHDERCARS